jgi:hypothetical protein
VLFLAEEIEKRLPDLGRGHDSKLSATFHGCENYCNSE